MSLEKQIQEGIKQAMIAKDKTRLESLRAIKSQMLLAKTAEGAKLEEDGSLSDDQILKLIQKLVKQHQESADLYSQNGRPELAEAEIAEAKVMEAFLPKQMSAEEIQAEVKTIIAEVGATSMKDMGKVMGCTSKRLAGKAEGKAIADAVKAALSAL
ncbi:MAG: GatB/YqeY domain-containing protein [Bacteroidales bacterium]|nr:GatB/YqeY domain-containing protein [Bacteroidales bacterium]